MNILLIVLNWVGKGTYWRALHLGQCLVANGHTVTLMATSRKRRSGIQVCDVAGVTQVETPDLFSGSLRSGWDLWNILNRLHWILGREFDLVHAFETRPTVLFPALYLQRIKKVPLVIDWADWFGRGGSVEDRPNPVIRTLLRPVETYFEETFRTWADGTTVICNTLLEKAVALGVSREQILYLPNGANIQAIQPQDRFEVRKRLGLPLDVFYVAYTGAIFQGDAELLAATFDLVQSRYGNTRLLLIGYCNIAVENLVQMPETVIRTGPISSRDLVDYVAASDIGLLPFRNTRANRGRFPMKIHDFITAGRPFVVTDVGDVGALLRQFPVGYLASDNPASLAEATIDLLNNPTQQEKVGREGRRIAESEFAWPIVTAKLEAFYDEVLSRIK